ncbi:MAG: hypothetical protein IPL46_10155 [Saprospiraceae bacterium]|nr:hypothetical protein [Saprospiraceae bacterium]
MTTDKIKRGLKLVSIQLVGSDFNMPAVNEKQSYKYDHSFNFRYNTDGQKIVALVEVKTTSSDLEDLKAQLNLNFLFTIDNVEGIKKDELPRDLVADLNKVVVGTTRGIMFNHYRGTLLHNALLPIVPDIEL